MVTCTMYIVHSDGPAEPSAGPFDHRPGVGVSLRRRADNTQAPASFVVHTETIGLAAVVDVIAIALECAEDAEIVASVASSVDASASIEFIDSSATQSDCVRTRTSNAVSML